MQDVDLWGQVLNYAQDVQDLNKLISKIMLSISDIVQKSEEEFGADSDEVETILDCVMDLRHSSMDDLLQFIDFLNERRKSAILPQLQ
jgi:hypothetical protein